MLLLISGNSLLLFSILDHQENSQKLEREIRIISENINEKLSSVVNITQVIAKPVYEYKIVTATALSSQREAIITADSLHKILEKYPDWELVDAVSEIATEHPNFGNSEYVTGLQPDVRTQQIKLILRRKINKIK